MIEHLLNSYYGGIIYKLNNLEIFARYISYFCISMELLKKWIMKQVVLNIPDDKYPFFMELIKNLDFVKVPDKVKPTKKQREFVEGVKDSVVQVEQHLKGETKLKTADQLYH